MPSIFFPPGWKGAYDAELIMVCAEVMGLMQNPTNPLKVWIQLQPMDRHKCCLMMLFIVFPSEFQRPPSPSVGSLWILGYGCSVWIFLLNVAFRWILRFGCLKPFSDPGNMTASLTIFGRRIFAEGRVFVERVTCSTC